MEILKVKKLNRNAILPKRATAQSAGYDLYACIDSPVDIPSRGRVLLPTGIAIEIGDSTIAAFIFGRSGLGIKHGLVPSNAVGVIDCDYRGEIMVALSNYSEEAYIVQPGERIAQLVLMPVFTPDIVAVDFLSDTERGAGGFGSTGK